MTSSMQFPSRLFELCRIAARWGLRRSYVTNGQRKKLDGPTRTLFILEEAGGVFLKFGQIFAMRFDIIPVRYAMALMNLFTNISPKANAIFFANFERETGRRLADTFGELDGRPLGVASFAQVYKATLHGMPIIIKIQKPHSSDAINADLIILRHFIGVGRALGFLKSMPAKEIITQFSRWLTQELDYRVEAANLLDIRTHIEKHQLEESVHTPRLYRAFLTRTTLVEQRLFGTPVHSFLAGGGPFLSTEDRHAVAEAFLHDLMRQYFVDGIYHADPHPGNLLVFPDKTIGYIDFGIVGWAKTGTLDILRFIRGAVDNNPQLAADGLGRFAHARIAKEAQTLFETEPAYRKASEIVRAFVTKRLEIDLIPIMEEWHERASDQSLSAFDRSSAVIFFKIIYAAEKYGLRFPPDVIGFIRALTIIDMVCLALDPTFNMVHAVQGFFEKYNLELMEVENVQHIRRHSYSGIKKDPRFKDRSRDIKSRLKQQSIALVERYPELYYPLHNVMNFGILSI